MTKEEVKQELGEIDERIEELREKIELADALERLHENDDFKKVILEGYFDKEAKRIFGLLVEPQPMKRETLENLNDMLSTIRYFKQYFRNTLLNKAYAIEGIEQEEQYRKELLEGKTTESEEA